MMNAAAEKLKADQDVGTQLEKLMIEFMVQYHPCSLLQVGDVLQIASHARRLAFDLFHDREAHS